MLAFLRSVLGGAAAASVTCEVVRGQRAPVKCVRVVGVDSVDLAYQRLLLAKNFGR